MNNLQKKNISKGLDIQRRGNEHWLLFESNKKHAAICIESKFEKTRIVKDAIVSWTKEQFENESTKNQQNEKFTSALPTEEGFYWCRTKIIKIPFIVLIKSEDTPQQGFEWCRIYPPKDE
jgi:hypothetical protein